MDAFTPPDEGPELHATGSIDIGAALMGGLSAFGRNIVAIVGAVILLAIAYG